MTATTRSGRWPIGTAAAELAARADFADLQGIMVSIKLLLFAAPAAVFVVGVAAAIVIPSVVPYVHNFAYVCPHRCMPDLAAEHACWPQRILRGRLGSWGGILGVGFVARRIA